MARHIKSGDQVIVTTPDDEKVTEEMPLPGPERVRLGNEDRRSRAHSGPYPHIVIPAKVWRKPGSIVPLARR